MASESNLNVASAAAPILGGAGVMTKEGLLGTPQAPIHMVTAEGGIKVQAWRTLRTLALGFLLISGVGALIEDRGIGKGRVLHIFMIINKRYIHFLEHSIPFYCYLRINAREYYALNIEPVYVDLIILS
jgi:hypothetical protein